MKASKNSLIIVGNGFDLAHKLNTSYNDFILWYLNSCLKNFKQNGKYDDELISINGSRNYVGESVDSIKTFLMLRTNNNIKLILDKNAFFSTLMNDLTLNRWVDVERIYYNAILNILDPMITHISKDINNLNSGFKYLKNLLIKYLNQLDYNITLISGIVQNLYEIFSKANVEVDGEKGEIYILNFNYTSVINQYVSDFLSEQFSIKIFNIHGKIDDPNSIIFGYGDEIDPNYEKIEHLNRNEYLTNFKTFGYLKNSNYRDLELFLNSSKYNTYIMGHSCGISDRLLLNTIFENENCESIKIFYHQKEDNTNDFIDKTMEISRNFKLAGKKQMRNIIIPYDQSQSLIKN